MRENTLRSASLVLVGATALSNVLGVIRDHFLASNIPTDRLDVYYAAFRLPDFVFYILIAGAISAAVIPVLSQVVKKDETEAKKLVSNVFTIGICALIIALGLLYLLMPNLMPLLAKDFNPEKLNEAVRLARIMLLSPLFFGISYYYTSVLNTHRRFTAPALAPVVYNLSIIIATMLWSGRIGVMAPVLGVIFGAFLHWVIQIPAVNNLGYWPKPMINFRDPNLKRIFKLMVPRSLAMGAGQLQVLAFTSFASALPGAIAIYSLADNIQTVPLAIIGNSLATALFPNLAHFGKSDRKNYSELLVKGIRTIIFFAVPAAAMLIIVRAQVIRLILGYGYFDWNDTRMALEALGYFALGIVAQCLVPILARAFYAVENTSYPMMSTLITTAVGIIAGWYGMQWWGLNGLAIAFTLSSWTNAIILWCGIKYKVGVNLNGGLPMLIMKVMIMTLLTAVMMELVKIAIGNIINIDRVVNLFIQTVVTTGVGAAGYLGLAWLWRIPEIRK